LTISLNVYRHDFWRTIRYVGVIALFLTIRVFAYCHLSSGNEHKQKHVG